MKIRVDDITEKVRQIVSEESVEEFPSLVALQESGECEFLTPLAVDLAVFKEYDHIRVKGKASVTVRMNCSRCLASYESDILPNFTMFYRKAEPVPSDEEEVELSDEDLVSATYSGEEIDFAPEIAEQVIMDLPYKPLCREDCLGLCPKCGADLNVGKCGCESAEFNPKFGALKNFKVEK